MTQTESLGTTAEHGILATAVHAWCERRGVLSSARAALDGSGLAAEDDTVLREMGELGWLGVHLPEPVGGSGSLLDLCVIAEQLGRSCAPGPFLPSTVLSAVINLEGSEQHASLLAALATGAASAGVGTAHLIERRGNGLSLSCAQVLHGAGADVLALAVDTDVILLERKSPSVTVRERENLDPSRPSAEIAIERIELVDGAVLQGAARTMRTILCLVAAAEACGIARACRDAAREYAMQRVAFGRPIGSYQSVKHHVANMLVEEQLASAAAWNAARQPITTARAEVEAAAAVAITAARACAEQNIQVHGGIAFTWDHDAHVYFRRACSLQRMIGQTDSDALADRGLSRSLAQPELDEGAAQARIRSDARTFVADLEQLPSSERHHAIVSARYLYPHWPAPWGRDAGPLEQMIIDEELAGIGRTDGLGPNGWIVPMNLPTIIRYGTADQQQRWIEPTLNGELTWCQLFSEPDAGSDLAALTTGAQRCEGGWLVSGQKVWTSGAHHVDLGFALVRTDPDAPKHQGITCMVIDMRAPGVEIRPLRQITGENDFNEVFLDGVFVAEGDVVGEVHGGWQVARATLGNERVSIGEAGWPAKGAVRCIEDLARATDDPVARDRYGALVARSVAVRALNLRAAVRAASGHDRGIDGVIAKLVRGEQAQALAEFGSALLGVNGVYADHGEEAITHYLLDSRAATIAGGTSEILRNLIAERALGLPRDAERQPRKGA